MKNKKIILISVICLTFVTVALLGLTYAYYRTRIIDNPNDTTLNVTSSALKVVYSDGTLEMNMEGNIEPGFEAIKKFTVQNPGNETGTYSVVIENVINTFYKGYQTRGHYNDWAYELSQTINGVTTKITGEITRTTNQILIPSIDINSKATHSYSLKVIYNDLENIDQSEDMDSNLSFKVNISDEKINWENAQEGTLLYHIKTNGGSKINTTEDDYGTSYYYYGDEQYNYVNYSGMCWRIVRVQGDGTIKLVLADGNNECNSENYNYYNQESAYISNSKYYKGQNSLTNSYIYENSKILEEITNWAENSDKPLDMSQLVKTEWCQDTVEIDETQGGTLEVPEGYIFYTKYKENTPTLKCDMIGYNNTTTTKYYGYLGLITYDEIMYTGVNSEYGIDLSYSYLWENATSTWWTLTPIGFYASLPAVMMADNGRLTKIDVEKFINTSSNIRPSIVLRSDAYAIVDTTSEAGTSLNPYRVY